MEIIKKTIKRVTVLENGVIVPDLNTVYFIEISLNNKSLDLGFFDVVPVEQEDAT